MTPMELDLMTAMGFLRPPALFKEDSPEVDTLKCTSHEDWLGVGHKVSVLGTMTSDLTG